MNYSASHSHLTFGLSDFSIMVAVFSIYFITKPYIYLYKVYL